MHVIDPVELFSILVAESLGAGSAVFKEKTVRKLTFRSLTEGNGITLTQNANDIQIAVDEADLNYPAVLNDFTDVTTTGVADKDYLQYESGSNAFLVRNKRETLREDGVATTVSDNTTATLLTLDKAVTDSIVVHYTAYRQSDSDSEAVKQGLLFCKYRPDSDDWVLSEMNFHDDVNAIGISWSIDASGNVQYTSTDYSDTGYTSHLKYNIVSELAI